MEHTRTSALSLTLSMVLCACGGGTAARPNPTPVTGEHASEAAPQSLDEGMAAMGLTRLALEAHPTESMGSMGSEPVVANGVVSVTEIRGWRPSSTVFARRADGTVVIVQPAPEVIVDRHVDGGCQTFGGGRAFSQEVAYTLPEGASYGGIVTVPYEEHTEVTDYTPTEPDGSPCPPMALD